MRHYGVRLLLLTSSFALLAAVYGVIHDQITYSLSPEYYQRFKFIQFGIGHWLLPERWLVAVTGVMATVWVGALAGLWLGILGYWRPQLFKQRGRMVLTLLGSAISGGLSGYLAGELWLTEYGINSLQHWIWPGVQAPAAFVLVGFVHAGSYAGAVVGVLLATILVVRQQASQ
ncbi:hypothetical protein OUO13_15265 [Oceanospirillaceae bacterium G-43]|uniref:Uncharacterized protein n=1 Tax=Parathalassolituus penaei TaxID=2997323 RepID=A0A9X3ITP8_9GAMM|nr:hypothetical protein [Parathalassolituus penaei]